LAGRILIAPEDTLAKIITDKNLYVKNGFVVLFAGFVVLDYNFICLSTQFSLEE
jgi:hypothetical protein